MFAIRKKIWLSALMAGMVLLSACGGLSPAAPTQDPAIIYTMAAMTVQAQLTSAAALLPTATPTVKPTETKQPTVAVPTLPAGGTPAVGGGTPLAGLATPTLRPGQQTAVPLTPLAANMPTQTKPAQQFGDHAILTSQAFPDNHVFNAGEKFQMFFDIKNTGSLVWNDQYQLVWFDGPMLSGISSVPVVGQVKPGEKYEFIFDATAPGETGKHMIRWKLLNAGGAYVYEVFFSFYVQ